MFRFSVILTLFLSVLLCTVSAQPRFKGKRLDTTQAVLGADSDVTKLIKFKDSVAAVGPAKQDLREPEPTEKTGLILLILGMVTLIVWAGRRAWLRQHKK
jgi:hypothetical protein